MSEIELGKTYRDTITDIVGVAVVRYDHLGGDIEIGLQAKVRPDQDKMETEFFRVPRLVDAVTGEPATASPLPDGDIKLGEEYRDSITDFVGRATSRGAHINGCIQWGLDPKVNEKGEKQKGWYFDDDRLVATATGTKAVAEPAPRGNSALTPTR